MLLVHNRLRNQESIKNEEALDEQCQFAREVVTQDLNIIGRYMFLTSSNTV